MINAFDQHKCQIYLSLNKIQDIRQIENAIIELESAIGLIEHNDRDINLTSPKSRTHLIHQNRASFLLDQLKYFIVPKHWRRYSITTQVFAIKVHGISPACFRLIQSSNCLNLPHEHNLLKINNSIGLESEYLRT